MDDLNENPLMKPMGLPQNKSAENMFITRYMNGRYFQDRKPTDTPTDDLAPVNRKFVTSNGTIANRPNSSVAVLGQPYFATDIGSGTPITYNGTNWVNGVGSVVALN